MSQVIESVQLEDMAARVDDIHCHIYPCRSGDCSHAGRCRDVDGVALCGHIRTKANVPPPEGTAICPICENLKELVTA